MEPHVILERVEAIFALVRLPSLDITVIQYFLHASPSLVKMEVPVTLELAVATIVPALLGILGITVRKNFTLVCHNHVKMEHRVFLELGAAIIAHALQVTLDTTVKQVPEKFSAYCPNFNKIFGREAAAPILPPLRLCLLVSMLENIFKRKSPDNVCACTSGVCRISKVGGAQPVIPPTDMEGCDKCTEGAPRARSASLHAWGPGARARGPRAEPRWPGLPGGEAPGSSCNVRLLLSFECQGWRQDLPDRWPDGRRQGPEAPTAPMPSRGW
ncbi:hypothetical protein HOLleu_15045 [Holothuria leucospilota]|uniref:Uncharacterized protein n=1 Tax=Holothuria leucospilota TaxID=206669 RepID=A0A9Q1C8L1_HOLLE|nr:hypothetical protein HOLleu_15045 [Holothuria leucospilota]